MTEVFPGVPGFDSSMSVSKWYEQWIELYKVFKIKATTIRNYEDGFRRTEEYIGRTSRRKFGCKRELS